jgi:Holliday junction resolvasome RuvABC endonuclease subunit
MDIDARRYGAWKIEESGAEYRLIAKKVYQNVATGKGNASKNLVISAMRLRGYNPVDDNEADALALLHCVLSQLKTIK